MERYTTDSGWHGAALFLSDSKNRNSEGTNCPPIPPTATPLVQGPSSQQPSRVAGDDSSDLGGSSAKDSPQTTSSCTPSRLASALWASYVGSGPTDCFLSSLGSLPTQDLDLGDLVFSSRYLTHSVYGSPPPVLLINHNQRGLSTSRISQQTCSSPRPLPHGTSSPDKV